MKKSKHSTITDYLTPYNFPAIPPIHRQQLIFCHSCKRINRRNMKQNTNIHAAAGTPTHQHTLYANPTAEEHRQTLREPQHKAAATADATPPRDKN